MLLRAPSSLRSVPAGGKELGVLDKLSQLKFPPEYSQKISKLKIHHTCSYLVTGRVSDIRYS